MLRKKQKYTKVNNSNYITKALRKEIMHISTKFEKERANKSKTAYIKQRNICGMQIQKKRKTNAAVINNIVY